MKPGFKTTEFWLTLAVNVLTYIQTGIDPAQQMWTTVISVAVYVISRMITKTVSPNP